MPQELPQDNLAIRKPWGKESSPLAQYSPNARARCQGCRDKIQKGSIRICAKSGAPMSRNGGYTNQYHHAECYRNRKDLTTLWGFRNLAKEDQKRFMTEEQAAAAAAAAASSAGGLEKRDANVAECTELNAVTKKQKNDTAAVKKMKAREIAEAKRLIAEEETQRTLAAERGRDNVN
eukprot:scaffold3387_cov122-Skeletonema_dohrnii-CCMP3373.AAC.3